MITDMKLPSTPKKCSDWTTHKILFAALIVNISANQFSKCQQMPVPGASGILLDCRNLGLTHIPKNLPHTNVTTLYLQANRITSIRSGDLDNFTELLELMLYLNQIRYIADDAFVGLSRINYLHINTNRLFGWPRKPMEQLTSLHGLDIRNVNFPNNSMTPFPKEFKSLKHIEFLFIGEGNSSLHISKNFFDNIAKNSIKTIAIHEINFDGVPEIEEGAFRGFTNLTNLDMDYLNHLSLAAFANMITDLDGTPLDILTVDTVKEFGAITKYTFSNFTNTNLTQLIMVNTNLTEIEDHALANLDKLEILLLNGTCLQHVGPYTFSGLTSLRHLDLSATNIVQCNHPGLISVDFGYSIRSLQMLYLTVVARASVLIHSIYQLKTLVITPASSSTQDQSIINIQNFTKLELLSCDSCAMILTTSGEEMYPLQQLEVINSRCESCNEAFALLRNLSAMKLIDVQYLNILNAYKTNHAINEPLRRLTVKCHSIEPTAFQHLTHLSMLDVSGNTNYVMVASALEGSNELREVNLANTNLTSIPSALYMQEMEVLDVRNTRITSFTKRDMKFLKSKSLKEFYASGNSFHCSCDLKTFIDWFKKTQVIADDKSHYLCAWPRIERVDRVNLGDCNHLVVIITVPSVIIVLCAVLAFVAFHYRWQLRFVWYNWTLKFKLQQLENEEDDPDIDFDAFVSYSSRDYKFVLNQLISNLEATEDEETFKLAVDFREFELGAPIVENIVEFINRSRKTIVLLSNNFIDSNWTMFEYHMACSKLSERRDVIILILLEPISHRISQLPGSLRRMLKNNIYIEWTTNTEGQVLFWKKLRRALVKRCIHVSE